MYSGERGVPLRGKGSAALAAVLLQAVVGSINTSKGRIGREGLPAPGPLLQSKTEQAGPRCDACSQV